MNGIETVSFTAAGIPCAVSRRGTPEALLIEPVGSRGDAPEPSAGVLAALACFPAEDWNGALSPWDAPPVFGRDGFGHGAADTLAFLLESLLPETVSRLGLPAGIPVILGGYSLAGLFSLWCAFESDRFAAVAAASPSVWFPGWIEYARDRRPQAARIYLSLGDREEKTRNRVMSTVGARIREQYALLQASGIRTVLEWNPGGHFADPEGRLARGFAWCLDPVRDGGER